MVIFSAKAFNQTRAWGRQAVRRASIARIGPPYPFHAPKLRPEVFDPNRTLPRPDPCLDLTPKVGEVRQGWQKGSAKVGKGSAKVGKVRQRSAGSVLTLCLGIVCIINHL